MVECVYRTYLKHLKSLSIDLLEDGYVISIDVTILSNRAIVSFIEIAETMLDNYSDKSKRIKYLLFKNILTNEQLNVLRQNNYNEAIISKYFSYRAEQVA